MNNRQLKSVRIFSNYTANRSFSGKNGQNSQTGYYNQKQHNPFINITVVDIIKMSSLSQTTGKSIPANPYPPRPLPPFTVDRGETKEGGWEFFLNLYWLSYFVFIFYHHQRKCLGTGQLPAGLFILHLNSNSCLPNALKISNIVGPVFHKLEQGRAG